MICERRSFLSVLYPGEKHQKIQKNRNFTFYLEKNTQKKHTLSTWQYFGSSDLSIPLLGWGCASDRPSSPFPRNITQLIGTSDASLSFFSPDRNFTTWPVGGVDGVANMILLMAEIRRSPVDIVVFSHYSHGFIHPFGGCLEFLNHQTVSLAAIVILGNLKPAEVPAKTIDHMTRLEEFQKSSSPRVNQCKHPKTNGWRAPCHQSPGIFYFLLVGDPELDLHLATGILGGIDWYPTRCVLPISFLLPPGTLNNNFLSMFGETPSFHAIIRNDPSATTIKNLLFRVLGSYDDSPTVTEFRQATRYRRR